MLPPRPAVSRRLFCLMAFNLADEGSYGDAVLRGVAGEGLFGRSRSKPPSLRGAKRRSNPDLLAPHDGLLRYARNDGGLHRPSNLNRQTRLHDLAARFARGLPSNFLTLQTEGAGNAGCTLHPRSRVQQVDRGAHEHTGQRRHPTFPAQWLYGLYRAPRSGRARCHRRRRNCFHRLDASIGASGPHDFTVRIRTVRQRHIRVHRIPSRACDDRETPLVSRRDEIGILLIWSCGQLQFRKIRNCPTRPRTSRQAERFQKAELACR